MRMFARVASDIRLIAALSLLAMLVATPLAYPVQAAEARPTALQYQVRLVPQLEVPLRSAPAVDLVVVTLEDEQREAAGLAPRFAIPNAVRITPETDGIWERAGAGELVWRLRVAAPEALSLNLGFARYEMPPGGRLMLYSADHSRIMRPFTAADNAAHGELWTPVIPAHEIVVEVTIPETAREELVLKLTSINVGYRGFGEDPAGKSGSCNVDVVCPEGDGWRDEIPSVGVISTGGSLFCTGFMVNNTAQDETPYFMTAYHCGIRSYNAASLVVYWNYETSTCGGVPDGSLSQFQTGSFFRAQYGPSDVTLVELDSDPDPAWGITFSGWDRSGANATTAVAIHHPSVDEKRISFEYQSTTTTSYLGTSVPGDGTHERVADWDVGTTEGGSSGSPLYNQDHRVIGQLHGGYAACGNNLADWYGKFSVSWTGGGTAATRLSDWLDPGNTGAMTVNTRVPGGCENNADCDDGQFCNGAEVCNAGNCESGTDPCPGQGCDETNDVCLPPECNGNGVCESGEDCNNCSVDCISGSGVAVCGNNVCEPAAGEDCVSCAQDCNGVTTGKPSGRYCCGTTTDCADSRCTAGGNTCDADGGTGGSYCCGDGTCEGAEDGFNCEVDCGTPPCGDTVCDGSIGETQCTCPDDCGPPASNELGTGTCTDGVDNDCDGDVDCNDSDCAGTSDCSCGVRGDTCSVDSECCSNRCHRGVCK